MSKSDYRIVILFGCYTPTTKCQSLKKSKQIDKRMKSKEKRPTEDLSMVPNLKCPLRKMGKSDQKVGAQADRPGINTGVNYNRNFSFLQHKFRIQSENEKWNEEKEPR